MDIMIIGYGVLVCGVGERGNGRRKSQYIHCVIVWFNCDYCLGFWLYSFVASIL